MATEIITSVSAGLVLLMLGWIARLVMESAKRIERRLEAHEKDCAKERRRTAKHLARIDNRLTLIGERLPRRYLRWR